MAETLAVGFFDGVHRGHQAILAGASRVLTFRNHPLHILAPARAPRLLMTFEARERALRARGARTVTALDFTRELAAMSPEAFAQAYLADVVVRCGANWRFGAGGRGDASFLRAHGYAVEVVPAVEYAGAVISSTRIRAALEAGEVGAANEMLARPFSFSGVRFRGKGEGSRLGFPTINLRPTTLSLHLPCGVYAVSVAGVRAVMNLGHAPTFDARAWPEAVAEIHVIDPLPPHLDVEETLVVDVRAFLRPERRFASLDDLRAAIAADIANIKADSR